MEDFIFLGVTSEIANFQYSTCTYKYFLSWSLSWKTFYISVYYISFVYILYIFILIYISVLLYTLYIYDI